MSYTGIDFLWVKGKEELSASAKQLWFREREAIRVLRGVVYLIKCRGPRTEPWGTRGGVQGRKVIFHI